MDRNFDKRLVARIIIEAETPLVIASGNKNELTDAEILRDVNGLPYIPGTSIAGVIRHAIDAELADRFFGEDDSNNNPHGSEIIFSEAKIVDCDGKAIDGVKDSLSSFLDNYKKLPVRNHVRIGHKGVTENAGKFDEEVIFKGTRFAFEVEMVAESSQEAPSAEDLMDRVLYELSCATFRIGGGTRKGFGKIKVVSILRKTFDLNSRDDMAEYLKLSSKLSEDREGWSPFKPSDEPSSGVITYSLTLTPQDFFYFGSGVGDDDVDDTPVKESIVQWENGKGKFKKDVLLIPASSLKGAIAHRVAFHYNLAQGIFAESTDELENHCGVNNPAVRRLFGYQDGDVQKRGCAIFNDILSDTSAEEKILNHVKIDRFTGGAMDGALFSEKVVNGKKLQLKTDISIVTSPDDVQEDRNEATLEESLEAFEAALSDINEGTLSLGGGNGRGHGVFRCEFSKK